jgi:hypothetical protein
MIGRLLDNGLSVPPDRASRPDPADAGGRDPAKLDDALALAKSLLRA